MSAVDERLLPWDPSVEDELRFGKILRSAVAVFLLLALVIPLLPLAVVTTEAVNETPPALARVILEKQQLPEPEPVVAETKPQPQPKPEPVQQTQPVSPAPVEDPVPLPEPVDTLAVAREAAAVSGVLAFQDDLRELRDTVDVSALDQTQTSRGESSAAQVQRAVVASSIQADSGGIVTAALSTDTGGAALSGRQTTTVTGTAATGTKRAVTNTSVERLGGRSDESIRRVMDANKGAIFAIYNRALRKDPLLEGKLVFEMVIDPRGNIEQLKLLSSELEDVPLTQKILSRINLIRFGEEQVVSTRVNYSFDFLPYT